MGSATTSEQKQAERPDLCSQRSRVPLKDDTSNGRWMEPWLGEWTYIVKNQVHSFDITIHKKHLMYTEQVGPNVVHGLVRVHNISSNRSVCITVKKMNFEIHLDRTKMVARYRTIGSSKWTKEIGVMKVDEIADEELGEGELVFVGTHSSDGWNKSTLRNTWKNTPARGCRDEELDELPSLPRVTSIRGSSARHLNSLKYTQQEPSVESDEIVEMMKENSTRRSIRFAEDVKKAFVESLMGAE